MLTLYLLSIVLWMMIIVDTCFLLLDPIQRNGWLAEYTTYSFAESAFCLFVLSAIPIIRLLAVICYFVMACMTEEELYDWIERHK